MSEVKDVTQTVETFAVGQRFIDHLGEVWKTTSARTLQNGRTLWELNSETLSQTIVLTVLTEHLAAMRRVREPQFEQHDVVIPAPFVSSIPPSDVGVVLSAGQTSITVAWALSGKLTCAPSEIVKYPRR
jgi:hypothetical protein